MFFIAQLINHLNNHSIQLEIPVDDPVGYKKGNPFLENLSFSNCV